MKLQISNIHSNFMAVLLLSNDTTTWGSTTKVGRSRSAEFVFGTQPGPLQEGVLVQQECFSEVA